MLDTSPKRIVVGVNSEKECQAAVDYAVAQARRRGCGVRLVFALPPIWLGAPGVIDLRVIDGELRKAGTTILMENERRVRHADPAVLVSTEIIHGPVVPSLVDESAEAGLVVLQHHRMNRGHHLPTLSVTNGVAGRAHAPVVAVPDTWREADDHPSVVAVGVEDAVSSHRVAEVAFEEAERLGAAVHLVRAWFFSAAFDADVFSGEAGRIQTENLEKEVRRYFSPLMDRFPDVECKVVVIHGRPADVLVARSQHVRLMVVGRHDPVVPLGSHLGPVTRAVLNHAASPVLVVDPRPDVPSPT